MKYTLLKLFKNELYNEAKRLVSICYLDDDLLNCSYDKLKDNINKKYKLFEVDIHMMTISLCIMKSEGKNYRNDKLDLDKLINHNLKVIDGKKEMYNEDLHEIANIISDDIIMNYESYNDETLFSLIPKLTKKYAKFHNDSVDWECIIMLLDEQFKNKNYLLESTNISLLRTI